MNVNKVHKFEQGLESDYIGLGPQLSAEPIQLDLSLLLGPSYSHSQLARAAESVPEVIEEIKENEVVVNPYIDPFEPIFESLSITPLSVEKIPDGEEVKTTPFHKDSVIQPIQIVNTPPITPLAIHGLDPT